METNDIHLKISFLQKKTTVQFECWNGFIWTHSKAALLSIHSVLSISQFIIHTQFRQTKYASYNKETRSSKATHDQSQGCAAVSLVENNDDKMNIKLHSQLQNFEFIPSTLSLCWLGIDIFETTNLHYCLYDRLIL